MSTFKFPRYTSSEMIHGTGIELSTFGGLYTQEIAQETIFDCHRTNFFHIFRYTGRRNVHYVEDKKLILNSGSLLIVNQNVLHRYARNRCRGNALLFTSKFFGGTQEKVDFLTSTPLLQNSYVLIPTPSKDCLSAVDTYFALIKKLQPEERVSRKQAFKEIPPHYIMILRNWLHNLLMVIEREHRRRKSKLIDTHDDSGYMQQFKALLDEHYQTEKQVSFYADKLGVLEKRLSIIVFSIHGFSAKEYINEKVLQEAMWLLENTTLNQSEIAGRLGFDFSYFVKFFRKHNGETPAKYRLKVKKTPQT